MADPTDTICALSTPPGRSGLAVIRVSGPGAAAIYGSLFRPRTGPPAPPHGEVTVDEVELGRRAVALIEEIRTGREPLTSQQRIVMPLKLSEGETLGAP